MYIEYIYVDLFVLYVITGNILNIGFIKCCIHDICTHSIDMFYLFETTWRVRSACGPLWTLWLDTSKLRDCRNHNPYVPYSILISWLSTTVTNAHQTSCFCQSNCTNASRAGPWDPILSGVECPFGGYLLTIWIWLVAVARWYTWTTLDLQDTTSTKPIHQASNEKNKHPRIIPHLEGCRDQ